MTKRIQPKRTRLIFVVVLLIVALLMKRVFRGNVILFLFFTAVAALGITYWLERWGGGE